VGAHIVGADTVDGVETDVLTFLLDLPPKAGPVPTLVGPQRACTSGVDAVLSAAIANNPTAPVAAINAKGLFVPMPSSVPLVAHTVIRDHLTALELVVPEDRSVVVKVWNDARPHWRGACLGPPGQRS
jgi:hypothetical protein